MRLAITREILGVFGSGEIVRICGVSYNAIKNWRSRNRIPADQLMRLAVARPDRLVIDDEGYPYWLEESEFEPPDWVPMRWWLTYLYERQRHNLGIDDDQLQAVVDALDEIRSGGGDVALALRYASTRKLSIPVEVERT